MAKLLFLNTSWMKRYDGMDGDRAQGGGSFVRQHGWGHEIYNFRPYEGSMYGYAPARSICVGRLGAPSGKNFATGVLAVWVATKPGTGGRYIVGWYVNATVFQREQHAPDGCTNRPLPQNEGGQANYWARAAKEDCVLLEEVKRANNLPARGPGKMGQNPLWYADGQTNAQFRQEVLEYIREQTSAEHLEKHKYGSGGEGPEHKALKNWCAQHPQELGLDDVIHIPGKVEFDFVSGDRADIMFERAENRYAVVEVETEGSGAEAGAHQALKYRVLMCAKKGLPVTSDKVQGLLVAWSVPQFVREFCERYGIRWLERRVPSDIHPSSTGGP